MRIWRTDDIPLIRDRGRADEVTDVDTRARRMV
jgi:hypothetical protein